LNELKGKFKMVLPLCKCGCGKEVLSEGSVYYHGSHSLRGKKPWNYGISPSVETKTKMILSRKGIKRKPFSEETKKHISQSLKGRKARNTGKSWSEEVKEKISKSHTRLFGPRTGKKLSKEMIDKRNETRKKNGWAPWNISMWLFY
jgi:hypothetical protein